MRKIPVSMLVWKRVLLFLCLMYLVYFYMGITKVHVNHPPLAAATTNEAPTCMDLGLPNCEKVATYDSKLSTRSSNVLKNKAKMMAPIRKADIYEEEARNEADSNTKGQVEQGILSRKPESFFRAIQQTIDDEALTQRCHRFGLRVPPEQKTNHKFVGPASRRIFYGSLIADESLELLQIIATETYGVFSAMVFVESNRTQNFSPRPLRHNTESSLKQLKEMFGTPKLQIRQYINENSTIRDLARESSQREEILIGWKEMGMTIDDIGYIADIDETFSRSFLRAMQTCPYVMGLDYDFHHCQAKEAKMIGNARIFESSPECMPVKKAWLKPTLVLGACVENIGNETLNPRAKRGHDLKRLPGYASGCNNDVSKINATARTNTSPMDIL